MDENPTTGKGEHIEALQEQVSGDGLPDKLSLLRQKLSQKAKQASAVTSKPANGGHPKTGQWKTRLGQHLLYPAQPRSGKEFQGKTFLWRAPEGREPRSGW